MLQNVFQDNVPSFFFLHSAERHLYTDRVVTIIFLICTSAFISTSLVHTKTLDERCFAGRLHNTAPKLQQPRSKPAASARGSLRLGENIMRYKLDIAGHKVNTIWESCRLQGRSSSATHPPSWMRKKVTWYMHVKRAFFGQKWVSPTHCMWCMGNPRIKYNCRMVLRSLTRRRVEQILWLSPERRPAS